MDSPVPTLELITRAAKAKDILKVGIVENQMSFAFHTFALQIGATQLHQTIATLWVIHMYNLNALKVPHYHFSFVQ